MRDYADEAYLHARIYAMRSRLLVLKDYVSMARNQGDAPFGQTAGSTDPVEAEETVFSEQTAGIIQLAEASRIYTPLFLAFLRQFEALNAKLILAKAFGFQPLEQWYDIGQHATLGRRLTNGTNIVQDIQPFLKGTYLEAVLEDMSGYGEAEIRVDQCALKDLYAASDLFNPQAKLDFQDLMGTRIAITSILLSLRLKRTYQWDDGRIAIYLQGFHQAFGVRMGPQMNILEMTLERYLEEVRATGGKGPDLIDIEHYLDQYYYRWISSRFHRDFHSIWCVGAYLWLLFYQIRNLFRIMEGRRFGFSPERILSRIVCNT
jgi:vacuolar-type H+-ATPase subunit C/Vma6